MDKFEEISLEELSDTNGGSGVGAVLSFAGFGIGAVGLATGGIGWGVAGLIVGGAALGDLFYGRYKTGKF